jgi:endonuclease III related protein
MSVIKKRLISVYDRLYRAFGPQHWWPADSALEIIIGAILTQNTAWTNVEKAIANLKESAAIDIGQILHMTGDELAALIRPSGYYNQKAARLQDVLGYIDHNYGGDLDRLFDQPLAELREELLALKGIGPETADSIILYAALKPVFVVDTYTRRIFSRLGLVESDIDYEPLRAFFEDNLPPDLGLYNEYHGLIVRLGNRHCRKRPNCQGCPVSRSCRERKNLN